MQMGSRAAACGGEGTATRSGSGPRAIGKKKTRQSIGILPLLTNEERKYLQPHLNPLADKDRGVANHLRVLLKNPLSASALERENRVQKIIEVAIAKFHSAN